MSLLSNFLDHTLERY